MSNPRRSRSKCLSGTDKISEQTKQLMVSFLQFGLFVLPFACIYTAFRATSGLVKAKNLLLAAGSIVLYLSFYYPRILIDTGAVPLNVSQMLVVVEGLISPTFDSVWLGLIWALLLVANAVRATGTRIGEVLDSKKLLVVSFWIVTAYSVYDSFVKAGGLSLILLTVPATTSLLAWGRKVSEYVNISD